MSVTVWLLAGLLLALLWRLWPRTPRGFPPGPTIFKLREVLWAIREASKGRMPNVIAHLRDKYGDIFGFALPTGLRMVHIFSFDAIKEAGALPQLAGRPNVVPFLVRNRHQKLGVSYNDGPAWSENRRQLLLHLRQLGYIGPQLDTIVRDEFQRMLQDMLPRCGESVNVRFHLDLATTNVIWRMFSGQRFSGECPGTRRMMAQLEAAFVALGPQNPAHVLPWLRHVLPVRSGHAALVRYRDASERLLRDQITEHRRTLDRAHPRDLIDQWLISEGGSSSSDADTDRTLVSLGMDLLEAGLTTTSLTLLWTLLLLVLHPHVQARVQREIDTALGGRQPAYSDRARLPYTQAVLLEVGRLVSVIPQSVPHRALSDATVAGYVIPRGSLVLLHLWAVHTDPQYWDAPEEFRPERFLREDGGVRMDERAMPFGSGRRACLGEPLARAELFVMAVCMLQRFTFSSVPGDPPLSTDSSFLALRRPRDFSLVYYLREPTATEPEASEHEASGPESPVSLS